MKAGQLSNLAKGFLVVYLILFVGQFFIFLMQNMSYLSYPDVKMLALVNLVQITAQVSGVVLLFCGRKPGFYVLVAERIANGIFYFTIVGLGSGAGMLGACFGVALFTAVAYACLRKDLPLLK